MINIGCKSLSFTIRQEADPILKKITTEFQEKSLNAIVGPSGCGKTTLIHGLLKLIPTDGEVIFSGTPIQHSSELVGQCGLVPQFSVAHSQLSVQESLLYTLKLTAISTPEEQERRIVDVLRMVGLEAQADTSISSLSGGQLRRLGLGLELVNNPPCLICDEVTSGLDPLSEEQILTLMRKLVEEHQKTLICIIHNLSRLPNFDKIHVLYEGYLVFSGDFEQLKGWFSIEDPLKLYHALATQPASEWASRWDKHTALLAEKESAPSTQQFGLKPQARPSAISQLKTLLHRRYTLLIRDTGYLWLLLALTFGFPCMVVIFALKGLPQIEGLALERSMPFIEELQQNLRYQMDAAQTATLVTGLILFQVVLLALMGANNGAREIASERQLLAKEKLSGLSIWAYIASKLIFVGTIALLQGIWMALFVKIICQFPGPFGTQMLILGLCCLSMTWVCLGLSALCSSPEKASLLSIYLVGFQLPLSGIVLALPDGLIWILRPFINAYWAWAGYFGSMKDFQVYDALRMQNAAWIPEPGLAMFVLLAQGVIGVAMVIYGCRKV